MLFLVFWFTVELLRPSSNLKAISYLLYIHIPPRAIPHLTAVFPHTVPPSLHFHLQGPQASVFLAELLVWSAMCEIQRSQEHCSLLGDSALFKSLFIDISHFTYVLTDKRALVENCMKSYSP